MKLSVMLIAVAGVLSACGGNTETAQRNPAPAESVAPASVVQLVPLTDDMNVLPEKFSTDNIRRVFNETSETGRSEFETTVAYRARLAEEAETKRFTFVVDPLAQRYDADAQRIILRLALASLAWTDVDESSRLVPVDQSANIESDRLERVRCHRGDYEDRADPVRVGGCSCPNGGVPRWDGVGNGRRDLPRSLPASNTRRSTHDEGFTAVHLSREPFHHDESPHA